MNCHKVIVLIALLQKKSTRHPGRVWQTVSGWIGMKKEWYDVPIKMPFENIEINVPCLL